LCFICHEQIWVSFLFLGSPGQVHPRSRKWTNRNTEVGPTITQKAVPFHTLELEEAQVHLLQPTISTDLLRRDLLSKTSAGRVGGASDRAVQCSASKTSASGRRNMGGGPGSLPTHV
jgi:hypothetical protein